MVGRRDGARTTSATPFPGKVGCVSADGTVMVRASEGGNLILPEPSRQNGYTPEHDLPIVISGRLRLSATRVLLTLLSLKAG